MHYLAERTRAEALAKLLAPIEWRSHSSLDARRALVNAAHEKVALVYPFLTDFEQEMARKWFKDEGHLDLWD